jgi:contact-dependent growth inhibition (CDI) system CdiA-like toxin
MKYKVIVGADISDSPKSHEFLAAKVLAKHFKSDVAFIRPANYKTPDFTINNVKWELKSPMGSSARTIENNMRTARKQSKNLIIDLSRIKIHQKRAISRIDFFLSKPNQFGRVLVITKTKKVIEIQYN